MTIQHRSCWAILNPDGELMLGTVGDDEEHAKEVASQSPYDYRVIQVKIEWNDEDG